MPNKNYIRGRSWEYEFKKELENLGCKVYRMAGSHGEVDLISFRNDLVTGYQCKTKVVNKPKDRSIMPLLNIGIMSVYKVTKYILRRKND